MLLHTVIRILLFVIAREKNYIIIKIPRTLFRERLCRAVIIKEFRVKPIFTRAVNLTFPEIFRAILSVLSNNKKLCKPATIKINILTIKFQINKYSIRV